MFVKVMTVVKTLFLSELIVIVFIVTIVYFFFYICCFLCSVRHSLCNPSLAVSLKGWGGASSPEAFAYNIQGIDIQKYFKDNYI